MGFTDYTLCAILPQAPDAALRVIMRRTEGYAAAPEDRGWMLGLGKTNGWSYSDYDRATHFQEFYSTKAFGTLDIWIQFCGTGTAAIELYEYDSPFPTRSKTITWQ